MQCPLVDDLLNHGLHLALGARQPSIKPKPCVALNKACKNDFGVRSLKTKSFVVSRIDQ
jgi:hypothetical protein